MIPPRFGSRMSEGVGRRHADATLLVPWSDQSMVDGRSSKDKFRINSWARAGLLPWILLGLSYGFDTGVSYGSFRITRWPVVFGLATGSLVGVVLITALLQRPFQRRWLRMRARLGQRTRILGLAAGVVADAMMYLFALVLLVLVGFQMNGGAKPDLTLPISAIAILLGLLVSTSILLGSQLPVVEHSVPDYKPVT